MPVLSKKKINLRSISKHNHIKVLLSLVHAKYMFVHLRPSGTAMIQSVRTFALHAEVWVLESLPQHTLVIKTWEYNVAK